MSTFKRGNIWWYEFVFRGQRIRESANTRNREVATRIERERRRKLELGSAGLQETKKPLLFSVAAKQWLKLKTPHWSTSNARIEGYNVAHLTPHFGKMLLADITADDISQYQAIRREAGASARTVNLEVGSLRAILRKHRFWANLQPDVRMLKVRGDVGRALSPDEQSRLLAACKASRSRGLYPAFLVSLHTGLRNAELRNLRWRNVDLIAGEIMVGKSKTAAGEGRRVPLSKTALKVLKEWSAQFPKAKPSHYVFPSEKYGLAGDEGRIEGKTVPYSIDPAKPIGSFKTAWNRAREVAGVESRWHDARHSFISLLAEGEASDSTIMSLAGHVSRKMMERYSHTSNKAKRTAILIFDREPAKLTAAESNNDSRRQGSPQISPQQQTPEREVIQ